MGRYAQSRRRGGGPPPASVIGPPPAPTLAGSIVDLVATANCVGNEGGSWAMYVTEEIGGALSQIGAAAWVATWLFGEPIGQEGMYAVCRQVGNGTAFTGVSALSNYVYLE